MNTICSLSPNDEENLLKALNDLDFEDKKKKPKGSTTQLDNEIKDKDNFCKNIAPEYGLKFIQDWGSGSKNKKENCDADITVEIVDLKKFNIKFSELNRKLGDKLEVSLKTEKGDFTIANGGTSLRSDIFKDMISPNNSIIKKKFKETQDKIKEHRETIGKNKKWNEVGQYKKLPIKEELIEFFLDLFKNPENCKKLYEWLNSRQSDLKCVGGKLVIPEKKIMEPLCEGKRFENNSVIVGHYKLRFKSSGGKVTSSWKINYELSNNNNL